MTYNPRSAIGAAIRGMDGYVKQHSKPAPVELVKPTAAAPCAVLLRSIVEGGPVPDDFANVPKTADGLRSFVRADGAVYRGAFELQGKPGSIVMVWGDPSLSMKGAERIATQERPALEQRHAQAKLGPFANHTPIADSNDH